MNILPPLKLHSVYDLPPPNQGPIAVSNTPILPGAGFLNLKAVIDSFFPLSSILAVLLVMHTGQLHTRSDRVVKCIIWSYIMVTTGKGASLPLHSQSAV